jgi:hypothetical protein
MNCIAARKSRKRDPESLAATRARYRAGILSIFLVACGSPATESAVASDSLEYETHYTLRPLPEQGIVEVKLRLRQPRNLLREVRFRVDDRHFESFKGEGAIDSDGGLVIWTPPPRGGVLSWQSTVANERNGNGYDAWLGRDWGVYRAEDIVPRAATRTLAGASSRTTVSFDLPQDWSVVMQYAEADGTFDVTHPERRFKQPSGWILTGKLGSRRDRIGETRVTIAGPVNNGVRRLDMLALLNWTLPELERIAPRLPERLTIISAGDPMWRGGLSAPSSLYVHAGRPLISENGTSTLLHEVLHVALGIHAEQGHDWIVEGLAEYYSLELLRRSGTVTAGRAERSRKSQRKWAETSRQLCGAMSNGATTARAVAVFIDLDREIRKASEDRFSMDDVVARLVSTGDDINLSVLESVVTKLIGVNPDTLHIDKLPGCRNMAAASE